jgi:hypothetical protein
MLKYLRIVVTVLSLMACVMLIVLWVRSYQTLNNVSGHLPMINAIACTSAYGRVVVGIRNAPSPQDLNFHSAVLDDSSFGGRPKEPRTWFYFQRKAFRSSLQVPHGFLVFLTLTVAATSWLPLHFSLRTLLIAMTLAALVLGLVVLVT